MPVGLGSENQCGRGHFWGLCWWSPLVCFPNNLVRASLLSPGV